MIPATLGGITIVKRAEPDFTAVHAVKTGVSPSLTEILKTI